MQDTKHPDGFRSHLVHDDEIRVNHDLSAARHALALAIKVGVV